MNGRFIEVLSGFLPLLGPGDLGDDTGLREMGLNSMRSVDLLFALEDAFGVVLPDEMLNEATFRTAGSLWCAVAAMLGDGAMA
jgi:acyl carrier protein